MKNNKKIVFEKIKIIHLPYVYYLLLRGNKVFVFNFVSATGGVFSKFVKRLIDNKKITLINLTLMHPHGIAIDQTETIFENMEKSFTHVMLAKLYQSEEITLVFKKILLNLVFNCTYIHSYFSNLANNKKEKIYFVPDNYLSAFNLIENYGVEKMAAIPFLTIIWYFQIFCLFERLLHRLFYMFLGVVVIFLKFVFSIFSFVKPLAENKENYKYAVSISSEHFIKYEGKRGIDFLFDGENINKSNTVFLIPNKLLNNDSIAKKMKQFTASGYNFFVLSTVRSLIKLMFFLKEIGLFFSCCEILKVITENKPFAVERSEGFFKACILFCRFKDDYNKLQIEKYIYSNQEGWGQIALNIYLRNNGVTTYNYSTFIGGGLLYAQKESDFKRVRHILWAYLNACHYFAVNDNVISYNKLHYQKIHAYHATGDLYSELIRDNSKDEELVKKILIANLPQYKKINHKIICYFDTTFIDDNKAFTSYDDSIDSCHDLLRLLGDYEDLFLIFKPSKKEDFFCSPNSPWSSPNKGQKVIDAWNSMKNHDRVYWAGDSADYTNVIAVSDLVITHCMSSPTLDALGARKKAIWYESGNKHEGLLYDQIPNLVIHGYNELNEIVNMLLFHTTKQEYDEFLDRYILGVLESHLDSQGLTRLRQHLTM